MAKVKNPTKVIPGYIFSKRTIKKSTGDDYTHNVRNKTSGKIYAVSVLPAPKEQKSKVSEVKRARGILPNTKMLLLAITAGRCEMCNKLVIRDLFTRRDILWGENAHIYAFSEGGSRAKKGKLYKNDVKNLFLVCPDCHTKIDKAIQADYYTAKYLIELKSKHEARIKIVTSFGRDRQTKVLKMAANIKDETVKVSEHEIISALLPERLFSAEDIFEEIDLTDIPGFDNEPYWESKKQEIDRKLEKFYSDLKRNKIEHVSVFGLGPIPLLMHLGSRMDNKIKTKIFQRHRDGEGWEWKNEEPKAKYAFEVVKVGKYKSKVALLLSLSGPVDRGLLPESVNADYYIYELSVKPIPNYNFLRVEEDLFMFEKTFTSAISEIKNKHPELELVEVFPAVPAPVAIVCGRSLNKNSDPKLKVFNTYNKKPFQYSLTIN